MLTTIDQKKKILMPKTPIQSPNTYTKKEQIIKMDEEINTSNKSLKKENIIKEKINDSDDEYEEIKKDENKENKNTYNLINDDEKELLRINLKKNIVIRILDINDEKIVDFCKFYKGYPTKKNIRIKYKTYLKIKDLLILN